MTDSEKIQEISKILDEFKVVRADGTTLLNTSAFIMNNHFVYALNDIDAVLTGERDPRAIYYEDRRKYQYHRKS